MKRIATIGAIAAVTAAGLSVAPSQAATPQLATKAVTTKSDPHFSPAERAAAIREAKAGAASTARSLRLPSAERLKPSDALADTNGAMHIRYNRTYEGLRVIGGDLVVHQDNTGDVTGVDYASKANIALRNVTPKAHAPTKGASLVVFAANHRPVLAWESQRKSVDTQGGPVDRLIYTNARNGKTIVKWDQISHADGTGSSLLLRLGSAEDGPVWIDLPADRHHTWYEQHLRRQQLHEQLTRHALHRRRQRVGHRQHLLAPERGGRRCLRRGQHVGLLQEHVRP